MRRAAIVLAVLVVAGCGGGNSNNRLTHAEFATKVEQLCRNATDQVKQIPQASGNQNHQIQLFVHHLRGIQSEFLVKARKLRPPVHDERLWKKALQYNERLLAAWGRIEAAAKRGDPQATRAAYEHLQAIAKNPYYHRLGMKGC